ncbi:MAG: hypothetical protein Q9205_007831 [Flavoplaca limonia]
MQLNSEGKSDKLSYRFLATDGTIAMYVGPDRKKFKFFRTQLLDQGPYFESQLRAQVDSLEFPEYKTYTFWKLAEWLYDRRLGTPTSTHNVQAYVLLYKLALEKQMDRLANKVMDKLRAYHLANQMISAEVVAFVYANTDDKKIRVLFCLELVMQARENHNTTGTLLNATYNGLVKRGGQLALDFPKLMTHCHKNRINWKPGRTFQPEFVCVFHTHLHSANCGVYVADKNISAVTKIREAFACIGR